jgi:hypothetical protein
MNPKASMLVTESESSDDAPTPKKSGKAISEDNTPTPTAKKSSKPIDPVVSSEEEAVAPTTKKSRKVVIEDPSVPVTKKSRKPVESSEEEATAPVVKKSRKVIAEGDPPAPKKSRKPVESSEDDTPTPVKKSRKPVESSEEEATPLPTKKSRKPLPTKKSRKPVESSEEDVTPTKKSRKQRKESTESSEDPPKKVGRTPAPKVESEEEIAKRKAQKEAKKLADANAKKVVDQRQALRDLCATIRSCFIHYKRVVSEKTTSDKDPFLESATVYLSKVNAGNYKFEPHKIQLLALYREYRSEFLSAHKVPASGLWLEKKKVECWLGKGTKGENQKIILKISQAYTKAILMHKVLHSEMEALDNENEQDEIQAKFEYKLYAELMSRLLKLMIYVIEGEDERGDVSQLSECIAFYDNLRQIGEPDEEDKEEAKKDATASLKKAAGGRVGGLSDMMGMVTDLLGGDKFMEAAEKKIEDISKMDKDGNMNLKNIMSVMSSGMEDFEPVIAESMGKLQGDAKKKGK